MPLNVCCFGVLGSVQSVYDCYRFLVRSVHVKKGFVETYKRQVVIEVGRIYSS